MLWMLMAAAATQPPMMIKNSLVMHDRDYPTKAIENGDAGAVTAHLSIAPDGRVSGCKVTETSGSEALDGLTCSIAKRRARFTPARDVEGKAIAGDYYVAVTWGTGKDVMPIRIPMQMGVKALPAGYAQPAEMHLLFGGDGKQVRGDTATSSGSAAADRAICAAIAREASMAPPKSGSDEPAAATRTYVATLTEHMPN